MTTEKKQVRELIEIIDAVNKVKAYVTSTDSGLMVINPVTNRAHTLLNYLIDIHDKLAKRLTDMPAETAVVCAKPIQPVVKEPTTTDKPTVSEIKETKEPKEPKEPKEKAQGWKRFMETKRPAPLPATMKDIVPRLFDAAFEIDGHWDHPQRWVDLVADLLLAQRRIEDFDDIDGWGYGGVMPYSDITTYYTRFRAYWLAFAERGLNYAHQVDVDVNHVPLDTDGGIFRRSEVEARLKGMLLTHGTWESLGRAATDKVTLEYKLKAAIMKHFYANIECNKVDKIKDLVMFKLWITCGGLSCTDMHALRKIRDYESWVTIRDNGDTVDGLFFVHRIAIKQFNYAYDAVKGKFDVDSDSEDSCEQWIERIAQGDTPVSVANILKSIEK